MKTVIALSLAAAVAIAAGAYAAVSVTTPMVYSASPVRPYAVLGPVRVALEVRPAGMPATTALAPALLAEARTLHGRNAVAVLVTDTEFLPNGTALAARGMALAWH